MSPPRVARRALVSVALALAASALLQAACGARVPLGVEPADAGAGGASAGTGAPPPAPFCAGHDCGAPCPRPCSADGGDCQPGHCDPSGACLDGPPDHCGGGPLCPKDGCGAPCSPCDPKDPQCRPSPAYLCDPFGACVFAVTLCPCAGPGCGAAPPWQPCGGRACGERCHVCAPGAAGCVEPPGEATCDVGGTCRPGGDASCPPGLGPCAAMACGMPCGPCGMGAPGCTSKLPAACDLDRVCRFGPPACDDPCAGEPPGAPCSLCPPDTPTCVEAPGPKQCDASHRCVPAP